MTSSLLSIGAPAGDVIIMAVVGCAAFLMLFFDVAMTTLLSLKEMLSITQCPTDLINARTSTTSTHARTDRHTYKLTDATSTHTRHRHAVLAASPTSSTHSTTKTGSNGGTKTQAGRRRRSALAPLGESRYNVSDMINPNLGGNFEKPAYERCYSTCEYDATLSKYTQSKRKL